MPERAPTPGGSTSPTRSGRQRQSRSAPSISEASAKQEIDSHEIAEAAYLRWEARGSEVGTPDEDWFAAEQEVLNRRQSPTGLSSRDTSDHQRQAGSLKNRKAQ
jgi:hypothetical protein